MLNDMIFIQRKEINLLTELLAPAKDKNTAIEAINCGADAVYMGAANFGARKNAPNSIEDIKEVINYAHKYRVKVFITVNTILDNNELEQAVKLVKELDSIGVDAIIIQDLGLLKRIMEENIGIPIDGPTPNGSGRDSVVYVGSKAHNRYDNVFYESMVDSVETNKRQLAVVTKVIDMYETDNPKT